MFAAFNDLARVELTLYTNALITRGSVPTRQRRVTDILNLAEQPFLVLEDVTVEEFGGRGQPVRTDFAQINLEAVLFAVANTPADPLPEMRTPKTQEMAIISVPPFKVTGIIHLMPTGGDLREALTELTGRFLPVTSATFWSDELGEGRQSALLVAVNHHRAQILAPHREPDLWAGLGGAGGPGAGPGGPKPPEPGGGW
jgi:hypothetical protein